MIACIFGKTGAGKSTLFKRMIRSTKRAIVVDPLSEHADLGACPVSLEDFREYWARVRRKPRWKIVLQPVMLGDRVTDPQIVLDPYFTLIRKGGRNYVVAVDEIDRFVGLHTKHKDISALVNYGRHWGVHLIAVARRTQAVHPELIAQCSDLYVFQMTRPGDVEYLLPYVGDEAAEAMRRLPVHQCVHWHVSGRVEILEIRPE